MWMGKIGSDRLLARRPTLRRRAHRSVALVLSLFAPLAVCLAVAGQGTQTRGAQSRATLASPEARERVRQAIPAVGLVLVRGGADDELRPRGSAVVVRKDGLVATNFHVIARDKTQRLYEELFLTFATEPGVAATATPHRYQLKAVLVNQERDLALLRILPEEGKEPSVFPFLELGDSQQLELLDEIVIIGFPEKGGTTVTVNTGVVEGKDSLDGWIKTDARLIHGNSGGAAVSGEGKLIGIPTKVVVDSDGQKAYGAVGYLRPAHLVGAMISKYQEQERVTFAVPQARPEVTTVAPAVAAASPPSASRSGPLVTVRGVVKTAEGKPVAGARVGLLPVGQEVNAATLITWGGSNAEGQFELEKPVPPGRYTLRAKAIGYEAFSVDVEVGAASPASVVIELRPLSKDE